MTGCRFTILSVVALTALSCAWAEEELLYRQFVSTNDAARRAWMDDAALRVRMAEKGTPPEGAPKAGVPQWYAVDGVGNLRDLGGWIGLGGRSLRKGMILRSAQLENIKDPAAFIDRFGVKTDLDLRKPDEITALNGKSPLGNTVVLVNKSAPTYGDFRKEVGKNYFKEVFPLFLDRTNYPIVFHCSKGADRTGSLAFLLQGLLGVSKRDQALDWELTAFFNPNPKFRAADRYDKLTGIINKRVGGCWTERFVTYALECGITKDDIEAFRQIMLEDEPLLRFGVLSDTHVKVKHDPDRLGRFFRLLSARNVDAVVISGDLTERGLNDEVDYLMRIWNAAFPENRASDGRNVEKVFIWGNHDYSDASYMRKMPSEELKKQIAVSIIGDKDAAWRRIGEGAFPGETFAKNIKGFWFVGTHWKHEDETVPWIRAHPEVDTSKLFFCIHHPPPEGTVFSPAEKGKKFEGVREDMRTYHNCFMICGHSHLSIFDDLRLWQGDFTVMHGGKPGQMAIVSVYADRMTVERLEFRDGEWFFDVSWQLPVPLETHSDAPYIMQNRK